MAKLFNLAQMTTATAGTGTITLGSAVAPFITFAAAGVQNNDVVAYSIIDGANSEMGYGTYSAAGPTLTRNLRKSSTGALLNLSGSAIVRLTPGREDIINPDGSIAFVANLDMGSNKIINVTDPSAAQDAATKNYVDNATAGITGSHDPVTLGIANGLALSNQVLSLALASSTTTGSVSAADWTTFNNKQAALGFTPENVANKSTNGLLTGSSDVLYPTEKAVKTYVDNSVAGITGSHSPVTLGTANGLSLSGQQLSLGLASGTSAGALSGGDWQLFFNKQSSLGFTPEDVANKTQLVRASGTSSILYPSESAVSGFVASSIANIPAAGGNIGSFLLSGGGVTWVTGYQFRVSAAQYYIQGVLYSSAEQLITLTASDATFDRIDVIVVNTSGQVDKVTGVATSSPSEPDIDPATQLQLAFIIVYAASSSPIINSQTIYSEKAGSPTEWNWSSTGSTWNLASTNNPFAGTKDIEATALGANAYAQGMATGTVNLGIYTQLNFYVRSKATWNAGRGVYVAWYSNGVRKGNNVFLAHGFFNFNSDNTTDYQLISIPISQFAVPNGTTVNQLRFTRVGGAIGFYLDEIVVTDSGLTSTPVGLTQEQADARYVRKSSLPWFVVKDYGAIGNGSTDDTVAIGAAVTALNAAGGGVLYFPAGTYKTSGGFTISVPALILGDGSGDLYLTNSVSKVTCTSTTAVLFTLAQHGCAVRDIALQNTAGSTPASSSAGIKVTVGDRNYYEHVAIRGFYIDLDIEDGGEQRIINCLFVSPVKYGVKFNHQDAPDFGGLYIFGSQFYAETYDADAGLYVISGGGDSVIGCAFNNLGPGHYFTYGIDVEATFGIATMNFSVMGCAIENYSGNGIQFQTNGSNWDVLWFVGNEIAKFINTPGYAIAIIAANVGEINDVLIDNLIVQTAGSTTQAIDLTKVNMAVVGSVTLHAGYTTAILNTSSTNVFRENIIWDGTYVDNTVPRIDGTTGGTLQGSLMTIDDSGSPNIPTGTAYKIGGLAHTHSYAPNAFSTISVAGQSDVVADSTADTLTLVSGSNVIITTNAGTDTITIAATGAPLEVKEVDGAPDVTNVTQIIVSNGKLTDNGSGSVSLDLTSGSGVSRSGATTDGHLAVWNGSSADSIKDGGTIPAGTALSNSDISPTTTDINAAVNTRYFANASGLTADRNFVLPTGTVGDQIELYMTTGHATNEFIIKGTTAVTINNGSAATEWSRLFITGETVKFVAQSPTNWIITYDGRIPCQGRLMLNTTAITSNTGGSWTVPNWNGVGLDVGNITDTTNDYFLCRRAGYYRVSALFVPNSIADTKYGGVSIFVNSTQTIQATARASGTSAFVVGIPAYPLLCALNDTLQYKFITETTNDGMARSDNAATNSSPYFAVEEVLRGA